jgi:hypothetical protein
MRDTVERMYRCTFHIQYKNQSNDSKIIVLFIFQEDYANSKGKTRGKPIMLVEMSKKMYNEMVREMNIIAL